MLDILGREVHKGDIIAYGVGKGTLVRYAETRLGIINNILGNRIHLPNSSMYKKILKEVLLTPANIPNLPTSVETFAKVTFYPLRLSDKWINDPKTQPKSHVNGKPKRGIILTTAFLKVSVDELNSDWLQAYTEAKKAFRL